MVRWFPTAICAVFLLSGCQPAPSELRGQDATGSGTGTSAAAGTRLPTATKPKPTATALVPTAASEPPMSALGPYEPGPAIAPLAAGQEILLTDIFMADTQTGWAVELNGHIVHTEDGGNTWADVTPPDGAFTADGFAMRDGHAAWAAKDVPPECWQAPDMGNCPEEYYPLLASAVVWKTVDGGSTWTPSAPIRLNDGDAPYTVDGKLAFSPVALQFVDGRTGWLLAALGLGTAGEYSRLYSSDDSGETWQPVAEFGKAQDRHSCRKIGAGFADENFGWMALDCLPDQPRYDWLISFEENPAVAQTTDGGKSWSLLELALPAVEFPPKEESGGNTIRYSYGIDSSLQFRAQRYPDGTFAIHLPRTQEALEAYLRFFPGEIEPSVWHSCFGILKIWSKGDSSGLRKTELEGGTTGESEFFRDRTSGWRLYWDYAAQLGRFERTKDGGQSWSRVRQVSWRWARFWFADDNNGWGLVQNTYHDAALVRTSDGGVKWTLLQPRMVLK